MIDKTGADVARDGLVVLDIVDGLPFADLARLTGVPLRQLPAAIQPHHRS